MPLASGAIVYVVDDDEAVRSSLRWLLEAVDLNVETCGSVREFLDTYDRDQPGCVLLDVRMPRTSGLELQRRLAADRRSPPIIIITGHGDVPMAVRAMKDGAFDFIEKPFNDQVLLERVQEAVQHDVASRQRRAETQEIEQRLAQLSPREREVLELVVAGKPTRQIAAELGVKAKTIEVHRGHILMKMDADNVADLVRMVVMINGSEHRARQA
jgi:RNA polymerase sigma factor (sigma-70 family)